MKHNITRVCIVDTVFTLFVYLLYSSEEELSHTFYFFSNGIAKSIRDKFPNHYFFDIENRLNKTQFWCIFNLGIIGCFRWPFLRYAKIYGHDHLRYSPLIIKKRRYILIEDGPQILSCFYNSKWYKDDCSFWKSCSFHFFKIKLVYYFISGVYKRVFANNKQCEAVILTEDDNVPYILEKVKYIVPLVTTWENQDDKKKEYIQDIFDLTEKDINIFQNRTHILLAQQFDGLLTEEEQIEIYRKIIEKYDPSCLVIKSHPRDKINYQKYFPEVYTFNKAIPMQLLLLSGGLHIKKAITICSSSINLFPENVEKEWIGTSIHPVLYEHFPYLVHNIYDRRDKLCLK